MYVVCMNVGLVNNVEPLNITPKSDLRPCQQYPLRREVVDGITQYLTVGEGHDSSARYLTCENSRLEMIRGLFKI